MSNDGTHTDTTKRPNLFSRWFASFWKDLTDNAGWKLCFKFVAGLGFLAGFFITLMTFQSSVRSEHFRRVEAEYQDIIRDLNNDNEWMRPDALSRVPAVFTRHVSQTPDISLWESLGTLFGNTRYGTPVFAERLRGQLNRYLHGNDDSKILSAAESRVFVRIIRALGPEGWYFGEVVESEYLSDDLSWIWAKPPPNADKHSARILHDLFTDVKMQGVDLSGCDLSGCVLSASTLDDFNLTKCHMNEVNIKKTKFLNTDFYNAQLRRCEANGVTFQQCKLESCAMNAGKFSGATFVHTYVSRADFSPIYTQGNRREEVTDLSRSTFIDCNITDIDLSHANMFGVTFVSSGIDTTLFLGASYSSFQNAKLESSTLQGVCFDECSFKNASLVGVSAKAARFRFSHFEGANLDKADLSNADLSDATGFDINVLLSGNGIASCSNTNIAGVLGLTGDQRNKLIELGAVSILDSVQWQRYKENGFPHGRWRDFTGGAINE